MYVGRVHYSFLDKEAASGYEGSYLGELKVLTFGLGGIYEPSAVYRNVTAAGVVQNKETVDYTAVTADVLFEYPTSTGVYTITSAYLKNHFDDAYKTNFNPGDRLANIAGLNGQKEGLVRPRRLHPALHHRQEGQAPAVRLLRGLGLRPDRRRDRAEHHPEGRRLQLVHHRQQQRPPDRGVPAQRVRQTHRLPERDRHPVGRDEHGQHLDPHHVPGRV